MSYLAQDRAAHMPCARVQYLILAKVRDTGRIHVDALGLAPGLHNDHEHMADDETHYADG
jgi:hypothetical protein